ncbi:MAG: glycosyltransferase 87 family protein [Anaerolineae bacterium]|nr:glycosyltransferase 87 family protein [Anaerolineae bacterium]
MSSLPTTRRPAASRLPVWGVTHKRLLTCVVLIVAFGLAPLPGGDDWLTICHAARRLVAGHPLYGVQDPHFYANPPHVAALLVPLSWLPFRLSYALLLALTLTFATVLVERWCEEDILLKTLLTIFSPPMFYILLHGQIDVLVLAGVLLPPSWWGLVALTKPQIVMGLALGIPRRHWMKAGLIVGGVLLLSLLLLGNWITDWLTYGSRLTAYPHNLWRGLWPFQVPLGLFFLLQGIRDHDEKLLIAASPFLVPYAALSSFIGVWLVALSYLNRWQSAALFMGWWLVVLSRL